VRRLGRCRRLRRLRTVRATASGFRTFSLLLLLVALRLRLLLLLLLLAEGRPRAFGDNNTTTATTTTPSPPPPRALLRYAFSSEQCSARDDDGDEFYFFVPVTRGAGSDDAAGNGSATPPPSPPRLERNPASTTCEPSIGISVADAANAAADVDQGDDDNDDDEEEEEEQDGLLLPPPPFAVRSETTSFANLLSSSSSSSSSTGDEQEEEGEGGGGDIDNVDSDGGVSFELWLDTERVLGESTAGAYVAQDDENDDNESALLRPILVVGRRRDPRRKRRNSTATTAEAEATTTTTTAFNFCDRYGVDFVLAARYAGGGVNGRTFALEVFYRTSDDVFEPCQRYPVDVYAAAADASTGGDGSEEGTYGTNTTKISTSTIVHVVVALGDRRQQVFVNGAGFPVLTEPFSNDLGHWGGGNDTETEDSDDQQSRLYLLSYPVDMYVGTDNEGTVTPTTGSSWWNGTIYQLAVFRTVLSESDVVALLLEGLPPSPPFALNYTVAISEDAEVVPRSHYDAPDWYLRPAPIDEADRVPLDVVLVDRLVLDFQASLGFLPEYSNSTTGSAGEEEPFYYLYVTKLPSVGCLYRIDGTPLANDCDPTDQLQRQEDTEITKRRRRSRRNYDDEKSAAVLIPIFDGNVSSVIYLPPLHAHSFLSEDAAGSQPGQSGVVFSTISYCVSETPVLDPLRCPSTGTVRIVVEPVNDPPVVVPTDILEVYEGAPRELVSSKMLLSGTDVDEDDFVEMVQVTEPPRRGHLTLSVASFREDGLLHGIGLSGLNYTVFSTASDPVYVQYVWDPDLRSSQSIVIQDDSTTDTFRFRVADRNGAWSSEEQARVVIRSALTASSEGHITIPEDSRTGASLKWRGSDTSGYRRDIGFFVEAIPSLRSGVLLHGDTRVQPGSVLSYIESYPYKDGVNLTFIPSPNYCTDPAGNSSAEAIQFRTVAYSQNDARMVTSVSDRREQRILIECVIDALTVTGPTNLPAATALALESAASDACVAHSLADSYSTPNCSSALQIDGIQLTSQDPNAEQVHVLMFTESGYLTLNPTFWDRAIPISGRSVQNAGTLRFLAGPNDLTYILSGLLYQSFRPGNDTIGIIVEYGDCSAFGPITRASSAVRTTRCQILRLTIPVFVAHDASAERPPSRLVSRFPWQVLVCMLGYPAIYYGIVRVVDAVKDVGGGDDDDTTAEDLDAPHWIQHYAEDTGEYYYENVESGEVTWLAPIGDRFVPWEEEEDSGEQEQAETRL